ncbi:MAG: hypothetical protein PHG56_01440 [Tissierellia bacterium]|nr:hypothetical protein [Tissierellia bacterium]MDD3226190.1 hypothetical protein [Tissierellia bacterium]MDD3750519.1 hypothetical protein [Tissierellia bacterium]MDD4045824.1 hypothetical protein [Tissierellia bacterium]MDD4677964.1 hypothetical protein [Tissierellia bacterium]
MDRLNKISTPDLTRVGNLNVIKLRRDGQYSLTSDINGKLNPNLNMTSKRSYQRMEDKSIVNNKPSQFRPILGVNFHNIKR